jgi:cytochrome c peroxidase
LREISRTAPYMHDGSIATLDEVIAYYDRGGNRHSLLDPDIQPLDLSGLERAQLRQFLETLVGR